MTVLCFFFCAQFGEGFADLREKEERIVTESVSSARCVEDDAFGGTAECGQSFSIAGSGEHADESGGALWLGNFFKFAEHAGIVRFVVGIGFGRVRLVGGVAGRMHSGSAAQSIDFEARVVGYDQFSGDGQAVGFCFLARRCV